jgi:CRISPR-associated protein Csh1
MYISSKGNNSDLFNNLNKFIQGYFINLKRGKETLVADFEYLPFNPAEKPFFRVDDVLGIENWGYNDLYSIWQLERIIDGVFFANRLVQNYQTDIADMQSFYKSGEYTKSLETLMLRYRKALHNYFRKGDRKALDYCADAMSKGAVLEILKMDEENGYYKAAAAFNLRAALIQQFNLNGDEKMADFILELGDRVRRKRDFETEQPCCDDDKEFFFVCGQLARFLFSLSEAAEPKHSLAESLIKSKDSNVLKKRLKELYVTYGHNILLKSMRFNNLMSMAIGYSADTMLKEYEDYFLAGFLSKNLLYEKKQEAARNENEQ